MQQLYCDTLNTIATPFLSSLSLHFGLLLLLLLFIWLFIYFVMRKQTRVSWLTTFFFTKLALGIHKAFACWYASNNNHTDVKEWTHDYSCLEYFSSSTHFHLVKGLARNLWRLCVLIFAHGLGYRGGNCHDLLANTGLFFPLVTDFLSPPSTPIIPFRLFTTAPDSIFPCLASKFRNRSFRSALLFTMVFNF